ncbi:MAG: exonuclease, partial [Waterburya sp.]
QQTFDGSIIDRISQYQVLLEQPTSQEIKEILQLKAAEVQTDLASLFTNQELEQIINHKRSIRAVLNNAAEYFRYKYRNIPLPNPTNIDVDSSDSSLPSKQILSRLEKLESQQNKLENLLQNIAQAFNIFVDNQTEENHQNTLKVNSEQSLDTNTIPSLEPKSLKEKIITYLETQQATLEQEYSEAEILLDEKDAGKLKDIIQAFKNITDLQMDVLPSKRVLPPHIIISNKNICIGFLSSCKGSKFTSRIQNYNEFVATKQQLKFILWRDVRSDRISQKTVGSQAIAQLNNTKNGEFNLLQRSDRLTFELIYQFISDIYNQDLEIDLDTELKPALEILADYFQEYWLMKIFKSINQ